jgi:hypothetical protein
VCAIHYSPFDFELSEISLLPWEILAVSQDLFVSVLGISPAAWSCSDLGHSHCSFCSQSSHVHQPRSCFSSGLDLRHAGIFLLGLTPVISYEGGNAPPSLGLA